MHCWFVLFVDQITFLIMCMCPIAIDIDLGRCFLNALLVRPGNEVSQSLSMALQSILTGRGILLLHLGIPPFLLLLVNGMHYLLHIPLVLGVVLVLIDSLFCGV